MDVTDVQGLGLGAWGSAVGLGFKGPKQQQTTKGAEGRNLLQQLSTKRVWKALAMTLPQPNPKP